MDCLTFIFKIMIKICDKATLNELVVIHYGENSHKPELMLPIENRPYFCKPKGGTWTSPLDATFGWKEWCTIENFRDCDIDNSFKLKFYDSAKIIIIDSLQDLLAMPMVESDMLMKFIDYELLAKNYDGIYLTGRGQIETHFSIPISLYGYDCETVLIFNNNCFEEI